MNLPTPTSLYTPPSVVHLNSESKFNQIHGVNELVIVMALAEDNLPQSVTVPTGSIAASAVTNPLEDLPPTIPLISIWDDKEHIVRLDVDGAKTWLCKGCNQPPTSHWNADNLSRTSPTSTALPNMFWFVKSSFHPPT